MKGKIIDLSDPNPEQTDAYYRGVDAGEALSSQMIEELEERIVELEDVLSKLEVWSKAYPLQVFPEPDLELVMKALNVVGITLDVVSASAMRHVLKEVVKIISVALPAPRIKESENHDS